MSDPETTEEPGVQFGRVAFLGREISGVELTMDRLAIGSSGMLYILSVADDGMKVKAARAVLNGGAKATIQYSGTNEQKLNVRRPGEKEYYGRNSGNVSAAPEGYQCYSVALGYSKVHAMFVARTPGFMSVVSSEALWAELNDHRFTTPVVREWLPYIEKQLRDKDLLSMCLSHRCECGILTATDSDLDKIVEGGLKDRAITIPDPDVIDVECVNVA